MLISDIVYVLYYGSGQYHYSITPCIDCVW